MKSIVSRRVFFTLTMFATLLLICSEANARGGRGGGGGRASGGRASGGSRNSSPRPSGGGSRADRAISNPGSHSAGAGNFSSRAGGLSSEFAGKNQLQGMLSQQPGKLQSGQMHTGQLNGKFSERNGQHQQNAQNKATNFQNGPQPFTPSWYAQHPNAWQATHPHAGAAAVVTTATVAAWVSGGYYAQAGSGDSTTTIIYEGAPEESTLATAPAYAATPAPAQPTNDEAWFPVGVYQLATSKDAPALLMLQLVVDHQGKLRGVYYDSITDTSHNIMGTLNPKTKVAQWQFETSSQVTFQTSLDELTKSAGTVQVLAPTGPQQWLLARMESRQ